MQKPASPLQDVFCCDEGLVLIADEGEEFSDDAMVEATGLGRDRFIDKGRCCTRVERCKQALELLLTRLSEGIVKGISWRKNLMP